VFLWEKWLRKLAYLKAITYIIIFFTTCYFTIHLISGIIYFRDNPNAIVDNNLFKTIVDPFFDLRHLPKYLFWLFVMVLTMTFLLIRDKFGPKTFVKFLRGNYFHPKREERIFMFMDLKSSTTIAENLGEEKYFNFLYDTFRIATPGILATNGEIYQYVGDEIVISWSIKKGLLNANCIQCYYKVVKLLKNEFDYFDKNYGVQPQFKAGLHFGTVIAGEMGIIKREIVYSGDVLNTASRIQSLCNELNTNILISIDLIKQIDLSLLEKKHKSLGKINLRGKQEKIELATLVDINLNSDK
jgi:adenylate cyclase